MVSGVNSRQSGFARADFKRDGRFNTDSMLLPFGTAGTFLDRICGFEAQALRLPGFFITLGMDNEAIAAPSIKKRY